MIFAPESIALSRVGAKTKTRRPVRKGELYREVADSHGQYHYYLPGRTAITGIVEVVHNGRRKWVIGSTYAMNPPPPKGSKARMGKQVERWLLKSIRCEVVGDISDEDALAEGVYHMPQTKKEWYGFTFKGVVWYGVSPSEAFLGFWRDFYKSDLTELVWVLKYELVKP